MIADGDGATATLAGSGRATAAGEAERLLAGWCEEVVQAERLTARERCASVPAVTGLVRTAVALTLIAACADQRAPRPAPATAPDPRLAAMFEGVMQASVTAAKQADELHLAAARRVIEERIAAADDLYVDLDDGGDDLVVDLPGVAGGVVGGVVGTDVDQPARTIELRYQRGLRDYPADLVDAQAEAARRALGQCLAADDDLADDLDRIGTVSLTVRIDHGHSPPRRPRGGRPWRGAVPRGPAHRPARRRRLRRRPPHLLLNQAGGAERRLASISIRSILVRSASTVRCVVDHQRDLAALEDGGQLARRGVHRHRRDLAHHDLGHDGVGADAAADQLLQHVELGEDAGQLALVEHRHLRDAVLLEQLGGAPHLVVGVDGEHGALARARAPRRRWCRAPSRT